MKDDRIGICEVTLLCLTLVACGGAPFTSEPLDFSPHDAAPGDANAAADGVPSGGEGSVPVDGGTGDDAALDGATQEADVPDACGPEDPFLGGRPYACPSDLQPHMLPAVFAWHAATSQATCGWWQTPPECQCQTSYNCACLKAHNVCIVNGRGAWQGCNDTDAPAPEVTCD